jgi:hypothetical protein
MMGQRFIVNAENMEKYRVNIRRTVTNMIRKRSKENREDDLDERILKENNTAQQIEDFSEAMRLACEQLFKTNKAPREPQKHKSVPWWTQELTVMRKTTNTKRRKYQRTRDKAEQREENKMTYFDQKSKEAATIKREKTK